MVSDIIRQEKHAKNGLKIDLCFEGVWRVSGERPAMLIFNQLAKMKAKVVSDISLVSAKIYGVYFFWLGHIIYNIIYIFI